MPQSKIQNRKSKITLLTVFCLATATAPARAEDWPRWRGPRGDGTWNGPDVSETWPAEGPRQVWKRTIGPGYGGIAVVDGRVYVMDRQKEPAEVERLLCLNAETGAELRQTAYPVAYGKLDYGNGPRTTPTVAGDRSYTLGAVGHVVCIETATGKIVWQHDLVREYGAKVPEWGFAASPVLTDELVIVHPGAPGGCLMAFDRRDGKLAWKSGDDPAGYATPILIDSPSGRQFVAWTPEHILGLDPATGKIHWQVPYKVTYGVSIATPIYHDGLVFVSGYWEGSKAIRLGEKPESAEVAWEENKFLRGLMSQPLYRNGDVFLLEKQYGLTCFELATGNKRWDDGNTLTPRGRNPQANVVWLDGGKSDRALALNSDGELILARLTREGYRELARAKILGETWSHPAFAGHHVFARNDSELVCVELP